MRKIILAITIMAVTLVYGQKNDLQKYQLKGKVETIVSNQYELVFKFGELTKGQHRPYSSYAFTFDENGNIIARTNYNSEENKFDYEYVAYQYATDGTIEFDNEYIKKQVKQKKFFSRLASDLTGEDIGGKVEEKKEIISKAKYSYTDNKVVIDRYRENGGFSQKIVRTYTNEGQLLSEIIYDSYGDPIEKDIRTYENGLLVKKETFKHSEIYKRGKGTEGEVSYIYDEKGNVVKEKGFEIGLGLKVDITKEYIYTFDEQGNWTQRTENVYLSSELEKEEKRRVTERKITYHTN